MRDLACIETRSYAHGAGAVLDNVFSSLKIWGRVDLVASALSPITIMS